MEHPSRVVRESTYEELFGAGLPQGKDFDPKKLDFISFEEEYAEKAVVLNRTIGNGDYVSMDAIIYDGKLYFYKEEDIDDMDQDGNYCQMTNIKNFFDE